MADALRHSKLDGSLENRTPDVKEILGIFPIN
jgi:hypothetical protein